MYYGIQVRSLTLFTALLMIGCAKAPAPETKSAETTPVVKDSRPVILAFGDSLSAGFGVEPGLSYPDFLQKELDSRGKRYQVVNEGISGDTTSGGVARITASLAANKPYLVIVELGGNDGLRGIPVETTRANLDQIVKECLDANAKVLLAGITLPRNYGPAYIRDFDRNYTALARKYNVPLMPFLLEGVALNPKLMQQDQLHPTAEGNRIVAANVMKRLEPLLP